MKAKQAIDRIRHARDCPRSERDRRIGLLLMDMKADGVECPFGGNMVRCRSGQTILTLLAAILDGKQGADPSTVEYLTEGVIRRLKTGG